MAVLAFNDAYVMSAWGKANNVTGDDIVSTRSMEVIEIDEDRHWIDISTAFPHRP